MRTAVKILVAVLVLASVGLGIGIKCRVDAYNVGRDIISSQVYSGRTYLEKSQYEEFKKYLGNNPDVDIIKLDILASDNPLVDFSIRTYGGEVFPWGELESTYYQTDISCLGFEIFFMCMGFIIFLLISVILGLGWN